MKWPGRRRASVTRPVDGVTGANHHDLTAAGLDEPDARGDVEALSDRVPVPGGAGAGREPRHRDT
jgi:hypothetical protein